MSFCSFCGWAFCTQVEQLSFSVRNINTLGFFLIIWVRRARALNILSKVKFDQWDLILSLIGQPIYIVDMTMHSTFRIFNLDPFGYEKHDPSFCTQMGVLEEHQLSFSHGGKCQPKTFAVNSPFRSIGWIWFKSWMWLIQVSQNLYSIPFFIFNMTGER